MGPAVRLWLFERHDVDHLRADLVGWLRTLCDRIEPDEFGELVVWFGDALRSALLGAEPSQCAFYLSDLDAPPVDPDDDLSEIGLLPLQAISLYAGCNTPADHRLLGHLTLALSRRLNAMIDFDGNLGRAAARLAQTSGRLLELPYESAAGSRLTSHIGDSDFLEAWLRHEDFHLIK